jgi:hypothetical protein
MANEFEEYAKEKLNELEIEENKHKQVVEFLQSEERRRLMDLVNQSYYAAKTKNNNKNKR